MSHGTPVDHASPAPPPVAIELAPHPPLQAKRASSAAAPYVSMGSASAASSPCSNVELNDEFRFAFLNGTGLNTRARQQGRYWPDNAVSTTKYSVWSFVPKNVLEFFSIVANQYFLLISLLQMFTNLNPESNRITTFGPLMVVLALSMLKQGVEDLRRHQADKDMNCRKAKVVRDHGSVMVDWRDIRVGDMLLIENNEDFPADVLLLASGEEEGRCFTETANLDGETNLKRRTCVPATAQRIGMWQPGMERFKPADLIQHAGELHGYVEYERPNARLYNFNGRLRLEPLHPGSAPRPGSPPRPVLGGVAEPGLGASPGSGSRIQRSSLVPVPVAAAKESEASAEPMADGLLPPVSLSAEQVVLRGCVLRNCSFVLGLVLFTGHETKVMQNARAAPYKRSKVHYAVNRLIFIIFTAQFLLMLASSIGYGVWTNNGDRRGYLDDKTASMKDIVLSLLTFLILYNNLVPISLYMTMEFIKVIQARLIELDSGLRCTVTDKAARARTSDLNEDLGQIEYVFSDKTGTLTCNIMEFRKCSVGGVAYGFGTTEIGRAAEQRRMASASAAVTALQQNRRVSWSRNPLPPNMGTRVSVHAREAGAQGAGRAPRPCRPTSPALPSTPPPGVEADVLRAQVRPDPTVHFDDPRLLDVLRSTDHPASTRVHDFLMLLAVCHTAIPERVGAMPDQNAAAQSVTYRASSPDEEALVKAARCLGYELVAAGPRLLVHRRLHAMQAKADVLQFDVLAVNEFTSTRKRMSVLVRQDNQYILMAKGADNVMFERILSVPQEQRALEGHLESFASEGLRTLVCAQRVVPADEATRWLHAFAAASNALEQRDEQLERVAELIERDMTIVGATAIEDKLQEGVPDTIAALASAGIKVWVLTGDKQETAINIGYACQVLQSDMELLILNQDSREGARDQLRTILDDDSIAHYMHHHETAENLALVVEGRTLLHLLHGSSLEEAPAEAWWFQRLGSWCRRLMAGRLTVEFNDEAAAELLSLASVCKAVVACRVSPKQKAAIVRMVRQGVSPQPMTLAIGDGANDVNMIQTAHVGIGISGQEGVQAVNASDFAIAQFRFLRDLVLVHGRHNYRRISNVILYSFYKNVALVMALFLYNMDNGVSGSTYFESIVKVGWNFFLALPIIAYGVWDRDVDDADLRTDAALYRPGPRNAHLNAVQFVKWVLSACLHAACTYFFVRACSLAAWGSGGQEEGWAVAGLTGYTCLLLLVNYKVVLLFNTWTWLHHVAFWGSLVFYLFFIFAYTSVMPSGAFYQVVFHTFSRPAFWALLLLVPVAGIVTDLALKYVSEMYYPDRPRILAEKWAERRRREESLRRDSSAALPTTTVPPAPRPTSVRLSRSSTRGRSSVTVQESIGRGHDFTHATGFAEYQREHRVFDSPTASPGIPMTPIRSLVSLHDSNRHRMSAAAAQPSVVVSTGPHGREFQYTVRKAHPLSRRGSS